MNTSLIGDLSSHYSSYLSYAAFLVGVLAILVTALICWQIFNYVFIKKEMNYMVEKSLMKSQEDLMHILNGIISISNSRAFFMSRFAQAFDDNMISLEEIFKSKNDHLNQLAITFIMNNLHDIKGAKQSTDRPFIYEDRKQHYLYLLEKVNHAYKNEIVQMINDAEEIPNNRDNKLRVMAENMVNEKC